MPLSWNEIKQRAITFQHEWQDESREEAEAKSFWDGFFNIFGISRHRVANFERQVQKSDGRAGYIDLFWKGMLLVEHKSRGADLRAAFTQALDYCYNLTEAELPRYILVSDFARLRLHDMDERTELEFPLEKLIDNIQHFGFMAGYVKKEIRPDDPANIEAAELMGELHDQLAKTGYAGHDLERFLVRLLFCLFADDSGIFDERGLFSDYIENRTKTDGSDIGYHLAMIFQVLNTPPEKRQTTLDEDLMRLTYVNGDLFAEPLQRVSFDSRMRQILLKCCYFDWSRISPAIFGSLFQSVMDPERRRRVGAHYTSEKNILKVINALFLDDLRREFVTLHTRRELNIFHNKITNLKILDPACGCGNFLVIAYRELRLLEIEILKKLYENGQQSLDIHLEVKVNVDAFYGIEIEEFPVRVAEVALWLMDHQMNLRVSLEFGQYYARLPLTHSAKIVHDNAMGLDWNTLISKEQLNYILGNPPFIGSKFMDGRQRAEMRSVFGNVENIGTLDYVTGWYVRAAQYIQNTSIKVAFVSTNSISQGEQVGILWNELLNHYHIKIHFAHRTFKWSNEGRGLAAVYCVIIGFATFDATNKFLYEYETVTSEPHEVTVHNINPYLVDAADILITRRQKPLCNVPQIGIGNKPIDDGNYLFTTDEKDAFLKLEPRAAKWMRRWLGADEFINGYERWCLWLGDCPAEELRKMPEAEKRVQAVRKFRSKSTSASTRELAEFPTRFHVENMPTSTYLVIPEVTSERRNYIPIGFLTPDTFCSNLIKILPDATLYHFGVMTSKMHMTWVSYVCGRLESRYRYSKDIVYNNFPWPESPTDKQMRVVTEKAQTVLDTRAKYSKATLADLYDPLATPLDLIKAHQALDRAVDRCYRKQPFTNDMNRLEFLFDLYNQYTAPLAITPKKPRRKSSALFTRR